MILRTKTHLRTTCAVLEQVGAPPEIASFLDEIRRENGFSRRDVGLSCLGADPELDEFMVPTLFHLLNMHLLLLLVFSLFIFTFLVNSFLNFHFLCRKPTVTF